ncbi:MAG: Ig-like domain-containing protein, partial [Parabacteroides sp.]|nr:Ig-like domain-containing protein [Parabacteroides sp.]
TSQFGTIFGDNMFITSKQPKDGGASIEGGRLNVVDAKTMKVKAQFTDIGGGDGRAFLGVNDSVGYIGASNGIFLFDIKNLTVGDQLKGASNSGGLYNGQVGMMVRTKTYVFAVQQSKGVLVIDPLKHEIIKLIEGSFSTLTQSKDGSVWVGAGSRLLCIDPETLEETYLSLPDGLTIPDSWYAWTAGVLCASTQENAIYWTKGGGFSSGNEIYRYEIGNPSSMDKPFYTIPEKGRVLYVGAGLRVSPDDKLYISAFENFGSINYWQYVVDAKTGRQLGCYPLEPSYWFPAMHIFPDNEAPVVKDFTSIEAGINDAPITVSLKDMATDKDNIAEAIYKSVKSVSNESLLSASILGDNLTLTLKPDQTGEATVSVNFDSNGKIVTKDLKVTVKGKAVYLDKHELSQNVGEKSTLKVTVPEGVSAVWTSSNSNVASVVNGEITAVAQGSAKIIVSAGNEKDTCLVNVSLSVQSLTLDVESDTTRVQRDGTLQLKVKLHPEGAVLPELLWNSSNTKVAHVNNKGLVTAFADGLAVIKVMSADSSKMDSCVIKVLANIQSVSLPESISLNTNSNGKQHTYTLKPTFIPAKPTNTVVSWKSSNEDIVTVSEKGLITAIKAGEATITVTTEDGSKTAECKVNCVQWPDAVKLDLTFVSMKPGNTQQLTITTTPDSIGAVPMKYVSDTPDVVTVDKNGVLTAKKYGEAIITVSPLSGADVKATCKVAVEIPVTSIQLDKDTICQKPNTFAQLTATINPGDATFQELTWKSTSMSPVRVSSDGKVSFVRPGKSNVVVTSKYGGITDTCVIIVDSIHVESFELKQHEMTIDISKSGRLEWIYAPDDASQTMPDITAADED